MSENKKNPIRTDLAVERCEMIAQQQEQLDDGVQVDENENEFFKTTVVEILNENGSKSLGRDLGKYITIECEKIRINDATVHEAVIEEVAKVLGELAEFKNAKSILVVGLGNWNVTPDALGPKVVSKMLVTRHIMDTVPEELENGVRILSALAPGVMGITGIETFEIIKGVTEKIKPDVIVAIDALAARKSSRINTTIQMSDTGVSPGSGVGNKRKELSKKTLGVPVVAIGVPTVVDAATLVNDTVEKIVAEMEKQAKDNGQIYKMIENLGQEDKYSLISEMLGSDNANMFVTPKEVDIVIERMANIISSAINIAAHPFYTINDVKKYC